MWGPFALDAVARVNVGGTDFARRITISTDGRAFVPVTNYPNVLEAIERGARPRPTPAPPRPVHDASPPAAPATMAAADETTPPAADSFPDFPFGDEALKSRPPPPSAAPPAPAAPAPEDVQPPDAGTLDELSVPQLYGRIAGGQLTGRLNIHTSEGGFAVFFKKGAPERVDVPLPGAALADFLYRRNLVPKGELDKALEISGGPEGELFDTIVSLGMVPAQQLYPLSGEHGVENLQRVLFIEEGEFYWTAGTLPPPGSFTLGQRWELLCQWARKLPRTVVHRRLGDRIARAAYPSSGARASLDELRLTPQEIRVASAFNGTRSPQQIAHELPGDPEVAFRTALLLAEVGYLAFGPPLHAVTQFVASTGEHRKVVAPTATTRPPSPPSPAPPAAPKAAAPPPAAKPISPPPPKPPEAKAAPAAAAPKAPAAAPKAPAAAHAPPPANPVPKAPVAPAAQPAAPRPAAAPAAEKGPTSGPPGKAAAETVEGFRALLEQWKTANHFEVLGIPQSAAPAEIKNAYLGLAKTHHPDTVTDPSQAELRAVKADLVARVNEAYRVLSDATSRTQYANQVAGGGQVDVGPILQAEDDFLRATILVKARKYADAIELLDRAIHLNPAEMEFRAWRAYAQFVSAKDKRALYDSAMAECARVAKEMPKCVAAHLFTGQMAKIMGDAPRAEKAFRQVIELEPKNIDALRELRMSGKS